MDWLDGIRRLQALTVAIFDGEELVDRLARQNTPGLLRDALTVAVLVGHLQDYVFLVQAKGFSADRSEPAASGHRPRSPDCDPA